jgi:hypothetical protein
VDRKESPSIAGSIKALQQIPAPRGSTSVSHAGKIVVFADENSLVPRVPLQGVATTTPIHLSLPPGTAREDVVAFLVTLEEKKDDNRSASRSIR